MNETLIFLYTQIFLGVAAAREGGSDPKLLSEKCTNRKHTKDPSISKEPRGNCTTSNMAIFFDATKSNTARVREVEVEIKTGE